MDKLHEIIGTMAEDDRKEFRLFIHRQKAKKERKDLELFEWLASGPERDKAETLTQLYPDSGNKVAYHALRKRLMRHLTEFIVLKRMDNDNTTASTVMGLLSLCNYLFERKAPQLAWRFLLKAEKTALENEQYDLLNAVYNLQIEMNDREGAADLEAVIQKRDHNKFLADEDERANIASSLIRKQLKQVRLEGKEVDFDAIIRQVLSDYQLSEAVKRPRLLYNLATITRSAVLAKKDFYTFEPFIVNSYEQVVRADGFRKPHQLYRVSLLYMIAHVLYRNKKFSESLEYLDELSLQLLAHNRSFFPLFYPRYILLKGANLSFSGRNEEAIALLESFLDKPEGRPGPGDLLNVRLNLAVYHFQQGDFRRSNRLLHSFHHSDKWCEKKMGREWVLRKNMVEMITQIELDNVDIAANRLRAIERNFRDFFAHPAYERVRTFLGLIRFMIDHPEEVPTEAFGDRIDATIEYLPQEREDLLAMSFYSWVRAKQMREDYYQTLLRVIGALEVT